MFYNPRPKGSPGPRARSKGGPWARALGSPGAVSGIYAAREAAPAVPKGFVGKPPRAAAEASFQAEVRRECARGLCATAAVASALSRVATRRRGASKAPSVPVSLDPSRYNA